MPKVQAGADAAPARGTRGRRVSTSLAEINVVPLVDVMLVLLIIFMVTAPMIQRGIDVNLPVARRAQQITGERLEVTVPLSYRTDKRLFLGPEAMDPVRLQELIRQKIENRSDKDVFLRGDRGVQLGELVEVTDLLKAAGVVHVGLVTKMPGER
jgi:biopolymer transport protein TolR